jgi:hypothetical protein
LSKSLEPDTQIERVTFNIAIINIIAMLEFGSKGSLLIKAISSQNKNCGIEERSAGAGGGEDILRTVRSVTG